MIATMSRDVRRAAVAGALAVGLVALVLGGASVASGLAASGGGSDVVDDGTSGGGEGQTLAGRYWRS